MQSSSFPDLEIVEEECEESLAESGDDGGKSLSRRRASDTLSRLSLHSESVFSSSMRYLGREDSLEGGSYNNKEAFSSSLRRDSKEEGFLVSNQGELSALESGDGSSITRGDTMLMPLDEQAMQTRSSSARIYPDSHHEKEPDQPLTPAELPSQRCISKASRKTPPKVGGLSSHEIFWRYMETISVLFHLATFGVIGVLIRFGLQVLFGPNVAGVTSDSSALYIDLPSNMVGSFFMGWVGVVLKKRISGFSESLAIGLSTGLMGSITTFGAWMQSASNLTTHAHWVAGIICILLGMELAQISLSIGIEVAQGFEYLFKYVSKPKSRSLSIPSYIYKVYYIIAIILCGLLCGGSIVITILNMKSKHKRKLGLACIVGPIGVWIRWYLSRLNGKGVLIKGKKYLKWCPFGTLIVNLMAASMITGLSIINLKVEDETESLLISAFTLGFIGCLSTVSTFVVEIRALYQSKHRWRAFAYIFMSIFPSFVLQTLIYSIPIWTKAIP